MFSVSKAKETVSAASIICSKIAMLYNSVFRLVHKTLSFGPFYFRLIVLPIDSFVVTYPFHIMLTTPREEAYNNLHNKNACNRHRPLNVYIYTYSCSVSIVVNLAIYKT